MFYTVFSMSESNNGCCGQYDDFCIYFITTEPKAKIFSIIREYVNNYIKNITGASEICLKNAVKEALSDSTEYGVVISSERTDYLDLSSNYFEHIDLDNFKVEDFLSTESIELIQEHQKKRAEHLRELAKQAEIERQNRLEKIERNEYDRLKRKYEGK